MTLAGDERCIDGLAARASRIEINEFAGAGETAGVGAENAVCAGLHGGP